MIPIKLQLKNFLSYGSELQSIDFGSYNLICLSGKNGHGKSALLDAITWAIWGQARKASGASRADLGLIRLGQSQMSVIFDFVFNTQHYRIRREISTLYGKNSASLEFGIVKEDSIITLTDKTIKATQDSIIKLLGLDYDSFINSAFLRQGSSNEFSKKTSKERKDILASILGLDQYEKLKDLATEKIRNLDHEISTIEQLLKRFEIELENLKLIQLIKPQLENDRIKLELQEQQLRLDFSKLEEEEKSITSLLSQADRLTKNKIIFQDQKKLIIDKLNSIFKNFSDSQQEIVKLPLFAENLSKLKLEFIEQDLKFQIINQLEQELYKLLEEKNNKLHDFARETEQLFNELNKEKSNLETQLHTLILQKKELGNYYEIICYKDLKNSSKQKISGYTQKISSWTEQLKNIIKDLKSLEEQLYYLKTNQANCLVCEQLIAEQQKEFVLNKINNKKIFIENRIKRLANLLENIKKIINQESQNLEIIELKINKNNLEIELNQKRNLIDEQIKKLNLQLKDHDLFAETKLAKLKNEISINQSFLQLEAKIKNYQSEIASFDKTAFKDLEKKYRLLNENQALVEKRSMLQKIQKERLISFADFNNQYKKLKIELANQPIINISETQEKEKTLQLKRSELTLNLKSLRLNYEKIAQENGRIEHAEQQVENILQEKKAILNKLELANQDIRDYKNIYQMMSKDGLQALLIEEAIPELEYEANYLLSRLTDNQCHIMIESLKDLKKGGTKETLDIKISDSAGVRPYEMFSGGEAFRIDFSLRIALSKLLARRAGTSLQTLIIDEGFGSQDDDGLNHIMDALHKVQDDFAKIIVVSHLPVIQEQFPVHFMVVKGPSGSKIQILEQG